MWSFLGKIEQVWTKVCAHLCAHFFMANSRFYLDNRRVQAGKPSLMKIAIVHQHKQAMINTSIKLMPEWKTREPIPLWFRGSTPSVFPFYSLLLFAKIETRIVIDKSFYRSLFVLSRQL
jgi:hypothetical protein